MHCKDCKFWSKFSNLFITGNLITCDGYCSIKKRVMIGFDLCKFIKWRGEKNE